MRSAWPLVVVFLLGAAIGFSLHDTILPPPQEVTTSDTVWVYTPVPPVTGEAPAVIDTSETAFYRAAADSIAQEKDSLQARLTALLQPQSMDTTFSSPPISGSLSVVYKPFPRPGFTYGLKFDPLPTPEIHTATTVIKRDPWWVRPAIMLGTATTIYYFTEKKTTPALIAGGLTLTLTIVEF